MYDRLVARILRKKGDKAGAAAAMERVIARTEPNDEVDGLLDLGWWYFEDGDFTRAEGYLTRALTIAKRTHDRRPPLFIARFLLLVSQPGADQFLGLAQAWGWTAPPEEARWATGGATPGVFTGTAGTGGRPPR
jgi:tetratricopeptide (TPR) repeat protein